MGNYHSGLSEEALEEYEALTFLTRKEIIQAWNVWKKLVVDKKPLEDNTDPISCFYNAEVITELCEVKHNPFQKDIIRCFAYHHSDGNCYFNFDYFLDLVHVMSPKTPQDIKTHFAFKLYDVDGDEKLDRKELDLLIRKLAGDEDDSDSSRKQKYFLSQKDREQLIDKLMEENGIESESGISKQEFKFIIGKCPDFVQCFSFTL